MVRIGETPVSTKNGTAVTVVFTVLDAARSGQYKISLSEISVTDGTFEFVNVFTESATVTVEP